MRKKNEVYNYTISPFKHSLMKILEVNRNQNTRELLFYSNVNHSPYAYTKCTKTCLKWMQIFFSHTCFGYFWICDKLKYALSENRRRKPQGSYALHSMQILDHDLTNGCKWSLLITCGQFKYYLHILFLKCVSYSLDKPPFHLDGWNKYEITVHNLDILHLHCSVRTTGRSKNFTSPAKRNDKHNIYL